MSDADPFGSGVISMARSCKAAVQLVRTGLWSLDDMDRWLNAVINQDTEYVAEAARQIARNTKHTEAKDAVSKPKTQSRHSVQRLVRGPSKREIKWMVKTLQLRNRHFFTGILPAEDVAMTCVLVWLGSRGMKL